MMNHSCQFPQITAEGLEDSLTHGTVSFADHHHDLFSPHLVQDIRSVYAKALGLSETFDASIAQVRKSLTLSLPLLDDLIINPQPTTQV
jgi:hypothetical protein